MDHNPDSWWLDETRHAGRENLDELHVQRYDAKMDADAAAEVRMLQEIGAVGPASTIVDLGAGTGQFALAAAGACQRVVAVDVSPVMLARLAEKAERAAAGNLDLAPAGFLSYEHTGAPPDLVYSRFALHHLPDFWKAMALRRVGGMLRRGGVFRLWDVVYDFDPDEAEARIEAWIADTMASEIEHGWTRAELAEHVRDEHSTYAWLMEPMLERAGFDVTDAEFSDSGMMARYLCRRR